MEVKEVVRLDDPNTGRSVLIHVTENELKEIVQAGLMSLLANGYMALKAVEGVEMAAKPDEVVVN